MENGHRLSHAYIVAGGQEKARAKAQELAGAMLCDSPGDRPCGMCRHCRKMQKGIHPDLIIIRRQLDDKGKPRREIYVEQIRELARSTAELPNEAEKKVYLIAEAGEMNTSAQNALLKILEEPPGFVSFILVAESAGQLLETVRSRCVTVSLNGEKTGADEHTMAQAEKYLDLVSKNDPVELLSFFNSLGDMTGTEAQSFVDCCIDLLTDMLCRRRSDKGLSRKHMMALVGLMNRVGEYLGANVGVKHIFGLLSVRSLPKNEMRK